MTTLGNGEKTSNWVRKYSPSNKRAGVNIPLQKTKMWPLRGAKRGREENEDEQGMPGMQTVERQGARGCKSPPTEWAKIWRQTNNSATQNPRRTILLDNDEWEISKQSSELIETREQEGQGKRTSGKGGKYRFTGITKVDLDNAFG